MPRIKPRADLEKSFWSKVKKQDGGCWEWTAYRDKDGYGTMRVGDKKQKAHRISYELHKGKIQQDILVCHTCDNPSCVRPDHLFLGMNIDNMADMTAKKRQALGEKNGQVKLTKDQVAEIRAKYKKGIYGTPRLAKEFGVTHGNIQWILAGRTRSHG